MNYYFIETAFFTEWVAEQSSEWDAEYADLQNRLNDDPKLGKVMKACGGLRKIRMPDTKRGRGKRGGVRVIYLHVPEADCICMIDAYGKNEKDDLNAAESRALAQLARTAKAMVLRAAGF